MTDRLQAYLNGRRAGRRALAAQPIPQEPTADFEPDLFALRSFTFVVGHPSKLLSDEKVWDRFYWSDGKCRIWRSPSYAKVGDWEDGTCTATCNRYNLSHARNPHEPPDEQCSCGIYGSLSYADLIQQFREQARSIVTVIAAEGATIVGERGLRTQYARVVAYWVAPTGVWPDFQNVACEVAAGQFEGAEAFDTPLEMVEAYGLALLPPPRDNRVIRIGGGGGGVSLGGGTGGGGGGASLGGGGGGASLGGRGGGKGWWA